MVGYKRQLDLWWWLRAIIGGPESVQAQVWDPGKWGGTEVNMASGWIPTTTHSTLSKAWRDSLTKPLIFDPGEILARYILILLQSYGGRQLNLRERTESMWPPRPSSPLAWLRFNFRWFAWSHWLDLVLQTWVWPVRLSLICCQRNAPLFGGWQPTARRGRGVHCTVLS